MAITFRMDPVEHLRSPEWERMVRSAAADWWQDRQREAQKKAG